MLAPGLRAQLACIWEATARKPGNVHRGCDFDDVGYVDFLASAAAISPVIDRAAMLPVGAIVLEGIRATRQVARTNTNLGILLLLAPLAKVPEARDLRAGVEDVLAGLTVDDARQTYEAIRLALPGGLGEAPEQDVRDEPTRTLREVMVLAAERDLIARQYADGFRAVFEIGVPALKHGFEKAGTLEDAIIFCHLSVMAAHPDSLIARKCGIEEALEASRRARDVLDAGWPHASAGRERIVEFDAWLRAVGHRRNPGTTADLVAACLYAALRDHTIPVPSRVPWS